MDTVDPQSAKAPKTGPLASDRLDSWKEIARYLNRDVRTVQRWEESGRLPVYRRAQERLKGSPVYAYRSELDTWLRQSPPRPIENVEPAAARRTRRAVRVVMVLLIVAVLGTVAWRLARSGPSAPAQRVVQLTSYPGQERYPAFSPDGKQVAFSWNGEKQDNFDIYVKFLDAGEPLRLTTDPAVDGWPAWSPDGRQIVFVRWVRAAPAAEVLTVPAIRGAERKIADFRIPSQPGTNYFPAYVWTPDGRFIIGPLASAAGTPTALALVSVEASETRPLTQPATGSAGDCCPALSPDGRSLAFLRSAEGRTFNVYDLELGSDYRPLGEPRRLTTEPYGAENPMWTGDSREVLYIAIRDSVRTLWRVPRDDSRPASQVESVAPVGFSWAISPRGDRLVYSDHRGNSGIWRVDLAGGKSVSRVVASTASDSNPDVSRDGKRIAFVSTRSGVSHIWVSGSDGANPVRLAPTIDRFPGPARWSPSGDQLLYECQDHGNDDLCVVPSGGGGVRTLTRLPARDLLPSWSRDGKWVYFTSDRSGSFQVWRAPAGGADADAVQLTKGGGLGPVESMDGKAVYFARERFSGEIWKVSPGGGEESKVGNLQILDRSQNFAVSGRGIYYASSTDPEHWFDLMLYRFSTAKPERLVRIDKPIGHGLSVSPDGRWLYFGARDTQSGDLYMVENFR